MHGNIMISISYFECIGSSF
jgi:hypothetical protein